MGLMIHSLGELPLEAQRGYYIYLLDYGWEEPLRDEINRNFIRMAGLASRNNAIVMRGTVGDHFSDEVLSWHQVNGQPGDGLLPAIMITTCHPTNFREGNQDRLLLIPLRKICKSSEDLVNLIEKIFKDIEDKKALSDFEVASEMKKGKAGAVVDALILEPNFAGIGINLNYIIDFFSGRKRN